MLQKFLIGIFVFFSLATAVGAPLCSELLLTRENAATVTALSGFQGLAHGLAELRWQKIGKNTLPQEIPYFALGFTDYLPMFSAKLERDLKHNVINYLDWPSKKGIDAQIYSLIAYASLKDVIAVVDTMIHSAPQAKVLLFNLDGFNFEKFDLFLDSNTNNKPNIFSNFEKFTNEEMQFLLEDANRFDHVRWFLRGKELSFFQLRQLFQKYNPALFTETNSNGLANLATVNITEVAKNLAELQSQIESLATSQENSVARAYLLTKFEQEFNSFRATYGPEAMALYLHELNKLKAIQSQAIQSEKKTQASRAKLLAHQSLTAMRFVDPQWIETISTAKRFFGLKVSSQQKYLFATDSDSQLHIYRLQDHKLIASIPAIKASGGQLENSLITNDEKYFIAASPLGGIRIVELNSGKTVGRININDLEPKAISINQTDEILYVANHKSVGANSLVALDLSFLKRPKNNLIQKIKDSILVQQFEYRDLVNNENQLMGSPMVATLTPDEKYLAVTTFDSKLQLFDAKNLNLVHTFSLGARTQALSFDANSQFLYVGGWQKVHIIDLATLQLVRTLDLKQQILDIAVNTNDSFLVVTLKERDGSDLKTSVNLIDIDSGFNFYRSEDSPKFSENYLVGLGTVNLYKINSKQQISVYSLSTKKSYAIDSAN